MPRIAILGDFHGVNGTVEMANTFADVHGCDIIVQCGDFWCYQQPSWRPLYWVLGNHEDWSRIGRHRNNQYELADNLYLQEDWSVQYFDDVPFAFVGHIQKTEWHLNNRGAVGGYKTKRHHLTGNIVADKSKSEDRIWMDEDPENIPAIAEAEVCIFHDKPRFDVTDESFLCQVVREVDPQMVVHGHFHEFSLMEPPRAPCPVVGLPEADGSPWFDIEREQQADELVGVIYNTEDRMWSIENTAFDELTTT